MTDSPDTVRSLWDAVSCLWGSAACTVDTSVVFRNLMLGLGAPVTAGLAFAGLWIALRRANTDRARQVAESFATVVELLGYDNRGVRLGAIYALERLHRTTPDLRGQIERTLGGYARERSREDRDASEEESPDWIDEGLVSEDVAAAFRVLADLKTPETARKAPLGQRLAGTVGRRLAGPPFHMTRLSRWLMMGKEGS
ncbi:hypothetical protein [Roseospira navarrensis]|uniref:Uncharacterized protein n=1 Tax=Roseospira navarrensis TaxID=140058 RepID=A0A7X2D5Y1_9PROT|nr:hypothetical protein [Roseospira navarrensis]MQX38152.1 hypothetical protein [Roseospira navarrensis]